LQVPLPVQCRYNPSEYRTVKFGVQIGRGTAKVICRSADKHNGVPSSKHRNMERNKQHCAEVTFNAVRHFNKLALPTPGV